MDSLITIASGQKIGVHGPAKAWGQVGTTSEHLLIYPEARDVVCNGTVDRLDFAGSIEDHLFMTRSGQLFILNAREELLARFLFNSDNPVTLAFADGAVQASYNSATREISLGGELIGNSIAPWAGTGIDRSTTSDVGAELEPVPTLGDSLEPNNTRETAAQNVITGTSGTVENLSIHKSGDEDWFAFTLDGTGNSGAEIRIDFTHAEGDLELTLFDASGSLIDSSHTSSNSESVSLAGREAGTYYIRIHGNNESKNNYKIIYNISSELTPPGEDVLFSEFTLSNGDRAWLMGLEGVTSSDFSNQILADPEVFDAEKDAIENNQDDMMCWAATAANMLAWTGWGQRGLGLSPLTSRSTVEDVIFDYFVDNFTLGHLGYASNHRCGIEWFFDGTYYPAGTEGYDQPVAGSGNLLGFSATPYLSQVSGGDVAAMGTLAAALKAGDAVGLSLDWHSEDFSGRLGGHAVTCWGYTYDAAQSEGSTDYYTGLIISDSDDRITDVAFYYPDPKEARDTLKIMELTWSDQLNAYYIDASDYIIDAPGYQAISTLHGELSIVITLSRATDSPNAYSDTEESISLLPYGIPPEQALAGEVA